MASVTKKTHITVHASKGGHARANTMTAEQRKEIAANAAAARWGKKAEHPIAAEIPESSPAAHLAASDKEVPYSMFRGQLQIGALTMECHVLSDGRRAFSQREMMRILVPGTDTGNFGTLSGQ